MMSPLIIIIPVVVFVILIVCGILCFCLLKKCVRWRAVSMVNPMRSTSDKAIIQNSVYTMSSIEGNYQTLGSLPSIVEKSHEKIPIEEDAVDNKKPSTTDSLQYYKEPSYPQELVIPTSGKTLDTDFTLSNFKYGNMTRNYLTMSFKFKLTQMLLRTQESIMNKRNMGVYNIRENKCTYYEENPIDIGETNQNYQYNNALENTEQNTPVMEGYLNPKWETNQNYHDNDVENIEQDTPVMEGCLNPSSEVVIHTIEACKSMSVTNNVSLNVAAQEVLEDNETSGGKIYGNIEEEIRIVVENERMIRIQR